MTNTPPPSRLFANKTKNSLLSETIFTHDGDALAMTWKVCSLTRALMMEGRSIAMKECIERLAIWSKDQRIHHTTGYQIGDCVVEVSMHVKIGFKQNQDDCVLVESKVMPVGCEPEDAMWKVTSSTLEIRSVPNSIAEKFLTDFDIARIFEAPWLRGHKAGGAQWRGCLYSAKGHTRETYKTSNDTLVIYLESDHELTDIQIPRL